MESVKNTLLKKISINKLHLLLTFSNTGKFPSFLSLFSGLNPFICETEKNYLSSAFAVTHISFGNHSSMCQLDFCSHCNSNICEEVPLLLQCMGDLFSHPLSTLTTRGSSLISFSV